MKAETLPEKIAIIKVRYSYNLKQIANIVNIPPSELSKKLKTDAFNPLERRTIKRFINKLTEYNHFSVID